MPTASSIDSQIRARTESFAAELALLVRQSALEAVQGALGVATVVRRAPRRARRTARAVASRPAVRKAVRRVKRTSDEVLELAARVHAHIRANAGQSVEQIGKAMRIPTKVLQLPIAKLLQGKKLRTEGRRRGTKYFVRGTSATAPARRGNATKESKARRTKPARRTRTARKASIKKPARGHLPSKTLRPAPRRQASKPAVAPPRPTEQAAALAT